jgi:hypothetical protein
MAKIGTITLEDGTEKDVLEQKGIQVVPQYPPAGCKDVNDYLVGMNKLQTEREKRQEAGL